MKRRIYFLILGLALLWAAIWHVRAGSQRSRADVATLANELSVRRLSESEVRQLLSKSVYRRLTLHEYSGDTWMVTSPGEFGATNWVVHITWHKPLTKSIRVRTADSEEIRPESAPQDKIFDN